MSSNFFENQRRAKNNSLILIILFLLAVVLISALTAYTFNFFINYEVSISSTKKSENFKILFFIFFAIIFIATLIKNFFRSKGSEIAIMLGGERVFANTESQKERVLLNIVEEMAIASGVPIPEVYILKNDKSINAFTAGTSSFDAVIGVNRGTIELLDRSELQAVIGHEFSHILNDDVKLNQQITAAIGGIMLISNIGQSIMRGRFNHKGRGNNGDLVAMILGFSIFCLGSVGVVLSRIIQSIISQQREYLADSSSVQFTRNPEAMTRALVKIGYIEGSIVDSSYNYEMDHMFFCSAIGENVWSRLISTHPSIEERIHNITPNFNVKKFLNSLTKDPNVKNYQTLLRDHRDNYSKKSFFTNQNLDDLMKNDIEDPKKNIFVENPNLDTESSVATVFKNKEKVNHLVKSNKPLEAFSKIEPKHLEFTIDEMSTIPLVVSEGLREEKKAKIIIVFVLYSYQPRAVQEKILDELIKQDPEDRHLAETVIEYLNTRTIQPMILFTLGLKTLQRLVEKEKSDFIDQIKVIFNSDNYFSFIEMMSLLLIEDYLFDFKTPKASKSFRLINIKFEVESFLYWFLKNSLPESVQDSENKLSKKFYSIISNLLPSSNEWGQQLPMEYERLKRVLMKLKFLTLAEKKKFLHILFATLTEKDFATRENFEKIRILCAILKVPIPPILQK